MANELSDNFADLLGFELLERSDGYAKVGAKPDERSLNGAKIVHGAYLFAIADFAFAAASNTSERLSLSAGATINYLAPCKLGEKIFATAKLVSSAGKGAIYDVSIEGESGVQYAFFHARASYKFLDK